MEKSESFEEQFPSLKGKIHISGSNTDYSDQEVIDKYYFNKNENALRLELKDVKEHCLDKQKVRDEINRRIEVLSNINEGIPEANGAMIAALESLKEELGL